MSHPATSFHVLRNLLRPTNAFAALKADGSITAWGDLAAALGRAGSAASSLRSSSAPPSRPSAGEHSELASESGFSYRMSISQPAEILTF